MTDADLAQEPAGLDQQDTVPERLSSWASLAPLALSPIYTTKFCRPSMLGLYWSQIGNAR